MFLLATRASPTATSFRAVLTGCASAKCHLSSQPAEAPATPQQEPAPVGHAQASSCTPKGRPLLAGASRSSQDQPAEPAHCRTPGSSGQREAIVVVSSGIDSNGDWSTSVSAFGLC